MGKEKMKTFKSFYDWGKSLNEVYKDYPGKGGYMVLKTHQRLIQKILYGDLKFIIGIIQYEVMILE